MFPDLTRDDVFRLETRRLWLRWPRQSDNAALLRFAGEKVVADMTSSIPHPFPPAAGPAFVERARRGNGEGESLVLAMAPRARPNDLVGIVAIEPARDGGGAELGYWVARPRWGEGLATEAARGLIDAFFAYTEGTSLAAWTRVINPASKRVLEKCGFDALGSGLQAFPARGGVFPVDHFRLDRRKWASLKEWSRTGFVPGRPADDAQACTSLH